MTALLDERIAQEDLPFRTDVLTSLYFVSQTLPDKEKYAREAYKTAQKITSKTSQTYTLINMGALYIYKNEKDSALFIFKKHAILPRPTRMPFQPFTLYMVLRKYTIGKTYLTVLIST